MYYTVQCTLGTLGMNGLKISKNRQAIFANHILYFNQHKITFHTRYILFIFKFSWFRLQPFSYIYITHFCWNAWKKLLFFQIIEKNIETHILLIFIKYLIEKKPKFWWEWSFLENCSTTPRCPRIVQQFLSCNKNTFCILDIQITINTLKEKKMYIPFSLGVSFWYSYNKT